MPVPDTTGQGQEPVIEQGGLVTAGLCDATQAFGPADSVFDLDAAARMGRIFSSLGVGQARVGMFFTAAGLAVGQALGRQVVVGDQAQVAQVGQQFEEVEQAQVYIKLIFKQLIVVGSPAGSRSQVVNVAGRVGDERVFTGQSFICRSSRPPGPPRPAVGAEGARWHRATAQARRRRPAASGPASRWRGPAAPPGCARCVPGP